MSTKLEKLKEVNTQLDSVLKKLETYVFIENIVDVQEEKVIAEQPKLVISIKQ